VGAEKVKRILLTSGSAATRYVVAVWSGLDIVACMMLVASTPGTLTTVVLEDAVAVALPLIYVVSKLTLVAVGVVIRTLPLGLVTPTAPTRVLSDITGGETAPPVTATPLT
jgi:hypothetical protein